MVVAAAAAFALAANALSPRGLKLSRDYFPGPTVPPHPQSAVSPPATVTAAPAPPHGDSEAAATDQRIKEKGLQPMSRAETERLFHDPRYPQGLVVFVDARSAAHYAESHIPGAYPLDLYYPDKDLTNDLTVCQSAEQVVVYCTGGDCEDAESTALMLRDDGIPIQKLFVYGGGFEDWSASHLPLEQGPRDSGQAPAENK